MRTIFARVGVAGAIALVGLGSVGLGVAACGADRGDAGTSGGSGGASSSGSSNGSVGGTISSSGGTISSSGGASSGGPIAEDDGVVPTTSIWRTTSEWYRPIDAAPVVEHSAQMIAALQKWGQTGLFQIDFSFNVLRADGAPKITFPPFEEGDDVPVPIPAKGYIEGDHAYDACPGGDDCHLVLFDYGQRRLYEVFQAHRDGSTWDGYVTLWKLDKAYPRSNRGQGCTSADAAGLPIAPGLIGYRETKKGAIAHALRFIIRNDFIRGVAGDKNTPNVAYPASHGTTAGKAATGIPYGGRLRLKSTIQETDSRIKTPGAKALVRALHTYGMILADGGNLPLTAESVKVYQDDDPAETWEGLLAPRDLDFLQPDDFEVIAIPKDAPGGAPGWYASKVEYEGQLQKPLGCKAVVQPQ